MILQYHSKESLIRPTLIQSRHSGECRNPVETIFYWMPTCVGMTIVVRIIQSILNCLFAVIMLMFCIPTTNVIADELGRLFTTPEERNMLEKLRHEEPMEVKPVEIFIEEPVVEEEEVKPDIGGITINGLVYRKGGKSTAWINNSNTYEGDLSNQYLRISTENIEPENVQIEIPESVTKITLKVGETYDPNADKVTDLTDTYNE